MRKKSAVKLNKNAARRKNNQEAHAANASMWSTDNLKQTYDTVKHGLRRFVTGVEVIAFAVIAVAAVAYWQHFTAPENRVITNIHLEGHQPASVQEAMRERLSEYQNEGFFDVDLATMQASLEEIPWVRNVSVNRQWPDALVVSADTWQPVAKWGEDQWLDNTGRIFSLDLVHTGALNLPELKGAEEDAVEIFRMNQQIDQWLQSRSMRLTKLSKLSSGDWQVEINGGIKVRLKSQQVFEGLQDFVKIDTQIAGQQENVDYIDMRYPNGAAIRWKQDEVAAVDNAQESTTSVQ